MSPKLPDVYIPKMLRNEISKVKEARYAIAFKKEDGTFGTMFGPFPDIFRVLDTVPSSNDRRVYLIRVKTGGDGTKKIKPIYKWSIKKECWVKLRKKG